MVVQSRQRFEVDSQDMVAAAGMLIVDNQPEHLYNKVFLLISKIHKMYIFVKTQNEYRNDAKNKNELGTIAWTTKHFWCKI